MGIKGLWTVLTPFSEKKSLHEVNVYNFVYYLKPIIFIPT